MNSLCSRTSRSQLTIFVSRKPEKWPKNHIFSNFMHAMQRADEPAHGIAITQARTYINMINWWSYCFSFLACQQTLNYFCPRLYISIIVFFLGSVNVFRLLHTVAQTRRYFKFDFLHVLLELWILVHMCDNCKLIMIWTIDRVDMDRDDGYQKENTPADIACMDAPGT